MSAPITYLDNNATTCPDPRVVDAITPVLTEFYGNPSSAHYFGARVAVMIEQARRDVAELIGARGGDIVFTSGGTEADNAALRGVLAALPDKRHLIISTVEHHAIFETAEQLERDGVELTRIGVDHDGNLDLEALAGAIRDDTALISVMLANNETGVVFPIKQVCEIAAERGVLVHTDAVNALGKIPVDVSSLGVDLLSLSSHKVYGPKGVGALYIRPKTPFRPCQIGGSHERGRRGGTLNAPGIVGLGVACKLLREQAGADNARINRLRDRLEAELLTRFPQTYIVGSGTERLSNTACVCFPNLPGDQIVMLLSEAGVCVSSGSACTSGTMELSHVLQAMRIAPEVGQGEIRFSLGRFSTDQDIDRLLKILPAILDEVATEAATE